MGTVVLAVALVGVPEVTEGRENGLLPVPGSGCVAVPTVVVFTVFWITTITHVSVALVAALPLDSTRTLLDKLKNNKGRPNKNLVRQAALPLSRAASLVLVPAPRWSRRRSGGRRGLSLVGVRAKELLMRDSAAS